MRRLAVVLIAAAGAATGLWHWVASGTPVTLPDAVAGLPCASYAPYHRPGQSPFIKGTVISRSQIDADLARLKRDFACVRIYSVDQGLSEVPRLARKHGLRVLLGLWIGADAADNERELARGIAVLKRDGDAIDAVIVGNEVLLRRDQSAATLEGYLRRVRAATPVPVTYADVWEFWLQNRELAGAVSFVTVHILPFWEDHPVGIGQAVDHVARVHAAVVGAFPGRKILVGETGWPSAGRQRGPALPSLVNQAHFVRGFANVAQERGIAYNIVEAFDQPWKRALEGTVGGHWGVFAADGQAKFPLTGAVAENAHWLRGVKAAGFAALAFCLVALLGRVRITGVGLLLLAAAGAGTGASLWQALLDLRAAGENALQMAVGGLFLLAALLAAYSAARALADWLAVGTVAAPAPIGALARWFTTNVTDYTPLERRLGLLRLILLAGASAVSLLLVADPRYRGFPAAAFIAPAIGYALLQISAFGGKHTDDAPEERALAWIALLCVPAIVLQEGLANGQALAWSATSTLFAVTLLIRRGARPASAAPA
ncbi:MAG: glycosyl hydrolase family 17 protein [Burkholderiales bacterium]